VGCLRNWYAIAVSMSNLMRWDYRDTGSATPTTEMTIVQWISRGMPMSTFPSTGTRTSSRASTRFA
jgi:hypothetical protein